MRIPYSLPNIGVIKDDKAICEIQSVQQYDEDDTRVYLRCAEYVDEFKRGFTCDFELEYLVQDINVQNEEKQFDNVKDLVLVHVNKRFDIDGYLQFEYVFYK